MKVSVPTGLLLALALTTAAFGQAIPGAPADAFQVSYVANLNAADSVINITNAGTNNSAGALTNICANVYAFSPDEQLVSCCSCPVTPNALVSLSAINDLFSNTLTPARPNSGIVKVVATSGATCNASNPTPATLASGLRNWTVDSHFPGLACAQKGQVNGNCVCIAAPGSTNLVQLCLTEGPFALPGISSAELTRLTSFCGFIQANGSGFGICRSCRLGGQGAVAQ